MSFSIFTQAETYRLETLTPMEENCLFSLSSSAAQNISNFKTLIPHQRNLALLWLHFVKDNRRTLFLQKSVCPQKMAKFPLTIIIKTFKTKQGFAYKAL